MGLLNDERYNIQTEVKLDPGYDPLPRGREFNPKQYEPALMSFLQPHPSSWRVLDKSDYAELANVQNNGGNLKILSRRGGKWIETRNLQQARSGEGIAVFVRRPSAENKYGGGGGSPAALTALAPQAYENLDPTVLIASPDNGATIDLDKDKTHVSTAFQEHTFTATDSVESVTRSLVKRSDPGAIYNYNPSFHPNKPPQEADTVRVAVGKSLLVKGTVSNSGSVFLTWKSSNGIAGSQSVSVEQGGKNVVTGWETKIDHIKPGDYTFIARAGKATHTSSAKLEGQHWLEFKYHDQDDEPVDNVDIRVTFTDGTELVDRFKNGLVRLEKDVKKLPFDIEVVFGEPIQEELKNLRQQLREALDASVAAAEQEAVYMAQEWEKVSAIEGGFIYVGGVMTGIGQWVGDTAQGISDLITGAIKAGVMPMMWMSEYTAHRSNAMRAFAAGDEATFKKEMQAIEAMHQQLGEDISDAAQMVRTLALVLYDDEARQMLTDYPMRYFNALDNVEQWRVGARYGVDILLILAGGFGVGLLALKGAPRIAQILKQIAEKWKVLRLWLKASKDVVDTRHELKPPAKQMRTSKTPESEKPKPAAAKVEQLESKPVKCFKKNKKGNPAEYDRQLQGQQEGLNNLTAKEYLQGRKAYTGKRASTAEVREIYKEKLIRQKMENGMSRADAMSTATTDMKILDALHNPDLIAGGKDKIGDFGDKSVNRSIGSQWKNDGRLEELDKAAKDAISRGDGDKKMNVMMQRCK